MRATVRIWRERRNPFGCTEGHPDVAQQVMDPIGGKVGMPLSFDAESGRSMPERTADALSRYR